jgi:7-cyano-7-deazaguanine synthase
MMDSLILLSGGLDSSAQLALAHSEGRAKLCLNLDYGQKAAASERRAAQALCHYYGVELLTLDLAWLGALGGSSLTDARSLIPKLHVGQLDELNVITKTMQSVWVPNRNGILLNVAGAYAERVGLKRILIGFNKEEATTFPDNSKGFLEAINRAFEFSTRGLVRVDCYTTELVKTEIVAKLRKLPKAFPFDLVWSCYHSGEAPCGECESCQRFKRAVRQGGATI